MSPFDSHDGNPKPSISGVITHILSPCFMVLGSKGRTFSFLPLGIQWIIPRLTLHQFLEFEWSYKRWTYKTGKRWALKMPLRITYIVIIYIICLSWNLSELQKKKNNHLHWKNRKIWRPVGLNLRLINPFLSSHKKSWLVNSPSMWQPTFDDIEDVWRLFCSLKCFFFRIKLCSDCKHIDN